MRLKYSSCKAEYLQETDEKIYENHYFEIVLLHPKRKENAFDYKKILW